MCEPSTSSAATNYSSQRPHHRRRQRRRPSRQSGSSISSPSSGLLSLLATVVSSSLAAKASPVSLSFLCPGVEDESYYSEHEELARRHCSRPSVNNEATTSFLAKKKSRRLRLPDRYVQGEDGLWMKTNWNLYGSTMCTVRSPPCWSDPPP